VSHGANPPPAPSAASAAEREQALKLLEDHIGQHLRDAEPAHL
jgi:hypothetical protein